MGHPGAAEDVPVLPLDGRLIAHHQGALDMSQVVLRESDDADIRRLQEASGMPQPRPPARGPGARPQRAVPGGNKAKPARNARPGAGATEQPDPMRTSVGYIGADSLRRQRQGQGGKSGPGSGARRSGRRG